MLLTTAPPITPPVTILNTAAATVPFTIQGAPSQSADLQQWKNSAGTPLVAINSSGFITTTFITPINNISGAFLQFPTTDGVTVNCTNPATPIFIVKGAPSQSTDLQRWTDSTPTTLAKVTNSGIILGAALYTGNTTGVLLDLGQLGNTISRDGTTGAITFNFQNFAGAGFIVVAGNAGTVPYTVRGAPAQSVDLQQWQNSTPTTLAKITNTGDFSCKTIIPGTLDTMSYASTIALDVTLAEVHKTTTINATGNATINASAGGTAGQRMTIIIVNDGTSGKTITFGTNFKPNATLVGTTSKAACVSWISDGTSWYETGRQTGL